MSVGAHIPNQLKIFTYYFTVIPYSAPILCNYTRKRNNYKRTYQNSILKSCQLLLLSWFILSIHLAVYPNVLACERVRVCKSQTDRSTMLGVLKINFEKLNRNHSNYQPFRILKMFRYQNRYFIAKQNNLAKLISEYVGWFREHSICVFSSQD